MDLFTNFNLKDLSLRNRTVMAPMCMYCAKEDGLLTDFHMNHYITRALGGVGLIIVEATAVVPNGRITAGDLGIWNDAQTEKFKTLCAGVHEAGGKIGIQLQHAGRKAKLENHLIEGPSPLAYDADSPVPTEMTAEAIKSLVVKYGEATDRVLAAGFDFIEIHGAHGYLIHEFLSPITNKRTDQYGGSIENRSRILAEVITEVKKHWPAEKPLGIRVSATDYEEGGLMPEDLAKVVNLVKGLGIDIVNVSTGGLTPTVPRAFAGYQLDAAEVIKKETGLPVIGGGMITQGLLAESAIDRGKVDLIYLGRELLRNPFWPLLTAAAAGLTPPWPAQYERGRPAK